MKEEVVLGDSGHSEGVCLVCPVDSLTSAEMGLGLGMGGEMWEIDSRIERNRVQEVSTHPNPTPTPEPHPHPDPSPYPDRDQIRSDKRERKEREERRGV